MMTGVALDPSGSSALMSWEMSVPRSAAEFAPPVIV
jgi:hypothetical protein